jgi:hypothetical protein
LKTSEVTTHNNNKIVLKMNLNAYNLESKLIRYGRRWHYGTPFIATIPSNLASDTPVVRIFIWLSDGNKIMIWTTFFVHFRVGKKM